MVLGRSTSQPVELLTEAYPELPTALHGLSQGPAVSHGSCVWLYAVLSDCVPVEYP